MNPAPEKIRRSAEQTADDDAVTGLSRAWSDFALAVVEEAHSLASTNLRVIADAAKQKLEFAPPERVNGDATAHGRSWSPWLVGAVIGMGIALLPRWK